MSDQPKFEDAPGLVVRARRGGWEARWQARTDLVQRGYPLKSRGLWRGAAPTEANRAFVSSQCQMLQEEMLAWGRGGSPAIVAFDGTLDGLMNCYQTDADSTYRKLRYKSRCHSDYLMRRIGKEHGTEKIADIKARVLLAWHKAWVGDSHVALGHTMIGQLRTLFSFGATILEDEECERLCGVLHKMRFEMAKPRTQAMTADQAAAIRRTAHAMGWHSIALAQAFQFDGMLRQKDVIGEWVPHTEPGISATTFGHEKWLRGLRWEEISGMVIRHVTSKRQKELVLDLRMAPMVMEELALLGDLPASGPVIVCEATGVPYITSEFRRKFRIVARRAGVPDAVKNMDSRAGAITEATDAGAPLEAVRHAATHSDIAMTQRYSRGGEEKTAQVLKMRVEHRKRSKNAND